MTNRTIGDLQRGLHFAQKYSSDFERDSRPHKRAAHDVLHFVITLGHVAAVLQRLDHEGGEPTADEMALLRKALPDLVVFAAHAADIFGVDLDESVWERVIAKDSWREPEDPRGANWRYQMADRTFEEESAWLLRMAELEEERGDIVPGGAQGGVIARHNRLRQQRDQLLRDYASGVITEGELCDRLLRALAEWHDPLTAARQLPSDVFDRLVAWVGDVEPDEYRVFSSAGELPPLSEAAKRLVRELQRESEGRDG